VARALVGDTKTGSTSGNEDATPNGSGPQGTEDVDDALDDPECATPTSRRAVNALSYDDENDGDGEKAATPLEIGEGSGESGTAVTTVVLVERGIESASSCADTGRSGSGSGRRTELRSKVVMCACCVAVAPAAATGDNNTPELPLLPPLRVILPPPSPAIPPKG